MDEKYKALESLKEEINKQIEEIEENRDVKVQEKLGKLKGYDEHLLDDEINEKNIDQNIKKLTKMKKRFNLYQRFLEAFERDLDIDGSY